MIVTFRTKEHPDIMMFGDVAIELLKMMGHSGTVPSAIVAKDVPAALARLKAAISAHKAAKPAVPPPVKDDNDDEPAERPVDLSHRALPLLELLEAAVAVQADVMWDQQSASSGTQCPSKIGLSGGKEGANCKRYSLRLFPMRVVACAREDHQLRAGGQRSQ